nr:hypothetical protein [uncultured Blautia sp.]
MKKRYLVLAALLLTAMAVAGCGKKKGEDTAKDAQVTVAPAENTDTAQADEDSLVEMQKSEEEDIKNIIGDKTTTSSKLVLINGTGATVKGLYIRPTTDDDDDWGTELINGMFTLADGDKALYYYDPNEKDADGNTVTSYDIRIVYEDEDYTDCYFRKLPLKLITQITLCMDGTAEDGIPYATYLTGSSKKETSTLSEVMARLGLDDSDSSEDDSDENNVTPTPQETAPTVSPTENPQPTQTPSADTDPDDSSADAAKQYIGQPLSSLVAALGDANGSDYENEPETGETGYHYYDSFTVSTTVDDSGNEIVAGVW